MKWSNKDIPFRANGMLWQDLRNRKVRQLVQGSELMEHRQQDQLGYRPNKASALSSFAFVTEVFFVLTPG